MSDFFKRQIQLWGEENQQKLENKSIAIIGCGGLGCSLALALGASGIKNIHLIDFDKIENHNIHRQIAFKLEDEGSFKAEILAKVLRQRVGEEVNIYSHICYFEDFIKKDLHVDLILDAGDNLFVRREISRYAKSIKKPWIYASVEEYNGQICFFQNCDFEKVFEIKKKNSTGQIPPMIMQVASFSANLALRYLVDLEIQKDRLYYLFYDKNGEFNHKSFNLPV